MIGKSFPNFTKESIEYYTKKLNHYCKIKWLELTLKNKYSNINVTKLNEANIILENIHSSDYVILMDENSKEYSSIDFANFIEKSYTYTNKNIVFIIGGAYGFDEKLYLRCNHKISLSKLTFSHQLVRLVLLEQIYRAFTIINNIPYHNE